MWLIVGNWLSIMDCLAAARSKHQTLAFFSLLVSWESSSSIFHPKFKNKPMFAPSYSSDSQLFSPSTIQVTHSTNISSITDQDNVVILILTDVNGVQHHQVCYPIWQQTSGKKCTKMRHVRCANLTASDA